MTDTERLESQDNDYLELSQYFPREEEEFRMITTFPYSSDANYDESIKVFTQDNFEWTVNTTPRGVIIYNFSQLSHPFCVYQAQFVVDHTRKRLIHKTFEIHPVGNIGIPDSDDDFFDFFDNSFHPMYQAVVKKYMQENRQN